MTSKQPQVTITDVARAAEVAIGTVSRVLNNYPDVNPEIRDKVLDTAQKLGYKRIRQRSKSSASRLPQASSSLGDIGVIFFGMDDTLVQLPVVSTALQGIEHRLSAIGRNLLLANIPDANRVPPFLSEGRISGLILKGPNQGYLPSDNHLELLRQAFRLPHIWLMGRLPNAVGDHCNYDNDAAGRIAAEHFAAKGHTKLAFFNPKPGQIQFEKLKQGFLPACQRLGLHALLLESPPPTSRHWPLPAITHSDNVDLLLQEWLAINPVDRPTGIFVPSDRTALQLDAALKQRNMRMGRDVSVISCNNETSIISSLSPKLTTVDVHAEAIGQMAVNQLLWRIQNGPVPQSMQILVEPTLVPGHSVADLHN